MSEAVEADRQARRLAQREFSVPLLLEAGAGTGKTAVLVARLVSYALGPGWIRAEEKLNKQAAPVSVDAIARETLRGVVAITFTEAAAAEMGRRVADALLEIRAGGAPIGVDREALPDEPMRSERARALVGALDQLTARTFHAFCRRLLVAHPFEAGVHPGLEVDVDGQRRAETLREILESRLPEVLSEPPDPAWEILLAAGAGPSEIEAAVDALLAEGVLPAVLDLDPLSDERVFALLRELRAQVDAFLSVEAGRLQRLKGAARIVSLTSGLASLFADLEREASTNAAGAEALARVCARIRETLEPEDLKALGGISRGRLGTKAADALGDDADALTSCAASLHPLLRHTRGLDPVFLAAAREVLHGLLAQAEPALRARGIESFGGLLHRARDLLLERPAVARKERDRTKLLLVDEFQDTDPAQCEILTALALAGDPASRPSLFVVGDPKQSIYGWRSADLRAYEAFRQRLVEEGGRVLPLKVNFRSAPAILDEVTRLVHPVMRAEPGVQPPFEELIPSAKTRDWQGYAEAGRSVVEHWVIARAATEDELVDDFRSGEKSELEARAVAEDLVGLRNAGVALGTVALLFRATSDFPIYLGALREAGIPFVVERETQHGRRREIIDASALVRCILDPHDLIAWVATLRSTVVGVPDAALAPLWHAGLPALAAQLGGDSDAPLEQALRAVQTAAARVEQSVSPVPLPDWPLLLSRFLTRLHALRRQHRDLPPEAFVEALREASTLEAMEAARHLGAYRVANLERFFRDLLEALETGAGASFVSRYLRLAGSLEREQREGRPRALRDDAVQVMTIHGAKGLDFDHVYLLQTHKGPPGSGVGQPTRVYDDSGACMLLGASSPAALAWQRDSQRVEESERVRLLYVALTRARLRLVISGPPRGFGPTSPRGGSQAELLASRIPGDGVPSRALVAAASAASQDASVPACAVDAAGVLWRVVLPELVAQQAATRANLAADADDDPDADDTEGGDIEKVQADARQLQSLARTAATIAARPRARAASERERFEDEISAELEDPERGEHARAASSADRDDAMQAGTLIHAVLERVPFDRLIEDAPAGLEAQLEAAGLVFDGSPIAARARACLTSFLGGPLPSRLAELAPGILARELPVLLAADALPGASGHADGPADLWRGAIDLLYRDPASGRLVVADYKTDAVEGEALEARARVYAGQGGVYTAAVQAALGLSEAPRFELWFLQAGVVVIQDTESA